VQFINDYSSQMPNRNLEKLLFEIKKVADIDPAVTEPWANTILALLMQVESQLLEIIENRKLHKPHSTLSFWKWRKKQDRTESAILYKVAKNAGITEYWKNITGIIEHIESQFKKMFEAVDLKWICEKYGLKYRKLNGVIFSTVPNNPYDTLPEEEKNQSRELLKERPWDLIKIYHIFDVLKELWVYGDDILVRNGENLPNMMRKRSYINLFIPRIHKTIFLCQDYWEATFVCDDFFSDDELIDISFNKDLLLGKFDAIKVIWNADINSWKENIKNAILKWNNGVNKQKFNLWAKVDINNWEWWRDILLAHQELLVEQVWIIVENGVWYFNEAKWNNSWPRIWDRSLSFFPNPDYSKKHGVWDKTWKVCSRKDLKSIFASLWIRVSTEEEEIMRWKRALLEHQELLVNQVWIIIENGVWYFDECSWSQNWPDIWNKSLRNFPNPLYNKENGVWDKLWVIINKTELKKMCASLGIRVATDEEEIERYKNLLIAHQELLVNQVWIIIENGVWYFDESVNCYDWPRIWGKSLINYPSAAYNKKIGAWSIRWKIVNRIGLKKMIGSLWIRVATDEEEIERYKNLLIAHQELLVNQVWIIIENGILYFSECKWINNWLRIWDKSLESYPNTIYNKENGVWNKSWLIYNKIDLKKMYASFGIRVATEEEELERYKNLLLSHQELLEREVWIIVENGVWYFDECRWAQDWPRIWDKALTGFPNVAYNKGIMVWGKNWVIWRKDDLKKMCASLGIRVATDEEEIFRQKKGLVT